MTALDDERRARFGRTVGLVGASLVGLLALAEFTAVRVLQIPGYLVMVGYDLIQNPFFPGVSGTGFYVLYAAYVAGLAVSLAFLGRVVSDRLTP